MTRRAEMAQTLSDDILATAMTWRQRVGEGELSVDDEVALEVWLQADDRHLAAYEQMGEVGAILDPHAASPELIGARRDLLARVHRQASGARLLGTTRRRIAAGAIAASLLVGVGAWPLVGPGEVYDTGRGERRVIILDDGSILSLDAMSRVSVRYAKDARRLKLQRGQARFDVAHDTARPFSVTARGHRVVATGTAFNIDLLKPEMRVTLIEGRVLVLPEGEPAKARTVELRQGQALVASVTPGPERVAAANLDQTTSWQQGRLVFNEEPLGQAVERVNRYTDRKITVADAQAAQIPLSGTFNAGDLKAFLEAVGEFLPVRVDDSRDGVVIQSIQGA